MTKEQEKKLDEVHTAIVGNELGNPGLVKRIESLEKYRDKDKLRNAKIAGGIFVGSGIFSAIYHWLFK